MTPAEAFELGRLVALWRDRASVTTDAIARAALIECADELEERFARFTEVARAERN